MYLTFVVWLVTETHIAKDGVLLLAQRLLIVFR